MKPERGKQHRAGKELDQKRGVFSPGVGKLWPSDQIRISVSVTRILFRYFTFCATKTKLRSCDRTSPKA